MNKCSRCGEDAEAVVVMFNVRPGGHALFDPSGPRDIPEPEQVCEKCLSPLEVARHPEVSRLMLFVLDGLASSSTASGAAAVETVKAYFQVRNNDVGAEERRGRAAAMRVMRTL